MRSTSVGVTSATGRVIVTAARSPSLISGYTSNTAENANSSSATSDLGSMRGWPATRRFWVRIASLRLACTVSEITSERTCGPYCCAIIFIGTLPGRKPAIFAVLARRARRFCTSPSICSIGTATCSRRSSCPRVSSVICIPDDSLLDSSSISLVVRKERLELSRLSAPAPKAGASTNSATFATGFAKQIIVAQSVCPRHEARRRRARRTLRF